MLFTSKTVGNLEIENRFVHSATYEADSDTLLPEGVS